MNREILFRGKCVDNGEWIEGNLLTYPSGDTRIAVTVSGHKNPAIYGSLEFVIPETVGQYTGLTDKNGKKIFEGDITKHRSNYSDNDVIAVVTYSDGYFLAMTEDNAGFNLSDRLEVIGNIHDNPELLEVSE